MNINNECRNFMVQSIVLFVLLNLCAFLAMKLWVLDLLIAIILSGCFILVVDIASALIFRWVGTKHPDMLPTFFTGVSGFRFLAALVLMAVCYVIMDHTRLVSFIVVFAAFYLASLIHHTVFFSRVSNRL